MSDSLPTGIDGPKLKAFEGDITGIQFEKLLSLYRGPTTYQFDDGLVFKVSIGGKTFALKVFIFLSTEELWDRVLIPRSEPEDYGRVSDIIRRQIHPFYAECRAFGQLAEKNQDGEIAVRCYGYVFLPEAIEYQIAHQFGIHGWNRKAKDCGSPLRAIVKDYIKWKTVRHRTTIAVMRKRLERLHELGIYFMDIDEDKYLGGRLFKFTGAMTKPHDLFFSEGTVREMKEEDMENFEYVARKVAEKESGQRRPVTRSQSSKILETGI